MSHFTRRSLLRTAAAAAAALPALALKSQAASHSTVHTVTIKNMQFTPANLAISAGDTVTWVNEDAMRHSATDLKGAFDTGLLATGQSATLTFGGPGRFDYRCTPHGSMRGSITVS